MKTFHFLTAGIIFFLLTVACNQQKERDGLHPKNLLCENLVNPMGIDVKQPRLSWISESRQRSQVQTAYRILVASTLENLNSDKGEIWDSRKIKTSQSVLVTCHGAELKTGMVYYWKVKVWDKSGKESEWSEPGRWSMGLLNLTDWKAKWIGLDRLVGKDFIGPQFTQLSARMLRKEFELTKPVKTATAYICGLGLYELYINGKKIGDQVLAPALTQYSKRSFYNTFDVTPQVTKGKNTIGVMLGNGRYFALRASQKDVHESPDFGFPKLLMQVNIQYDDGSKELIFTDDSWKLITEGPVIANNEYDGEIYDARKEMPGWNETGFDDSKWMHAEPVKQPSDHLEAQMIDPIRITQTLEPVSLKEIKPGVWIFDMGQNMVGWVKIAVNGGKKGTEIKMRFAETLQKDGSLYLANIRSAKVTDVYIKKGDGPETYEPRFVYHGFRYVELTGYPGKPQLHTLEGKVVHDDMGNSGTFETSNEVINQVYKNARWGIRGNYRSIPTDCPQRDERMGWLGDRATGSKGESYIFDIVKLYSKWLRDIQDAQNEQGSIPDVAPTYWKLYNDNTTWAGTYIIIADMLYLHSGDTGIIKTHYPSMKKWMEYMKKYIKDGLLDKDTYGDWCMPPESLNLIHSRDPRRITSASMIGTTYFYHESKIMENFARLLNLPEDSRMFSEQAESLKNALNTRLFDKNFEIYGNNSSTSSLLPLAFNMVPVNYREKVFGNFVGKLIAEADTHINVGLVGAQWVMRILSDFGRIDLAYKLATNTTYPSWGYMAANGATTIWELWNGNTADPAMNSGNHVMLLGDLIVWFYEYLAGIQPDPAKPGFKYIIMKPYPVDGLAHVKASYQSKYGQIISSWKIKDGSFSWDISIPVNTTATIYLPAKDKKMVKESNTNASRVEGIRFIRHENGRCVFEIGSGKYSFEAPYSEEKISCKQYTLTPVIKPVDTSVVSPAKVTFTMNCAAKGAEIRYTLDGSKPDMNSMLYTSPVTVNKQSVLLAFASIKDFMPSPICMAVADVYDPKVNGLRYEYFEGEWKILPDFSKLKAIKAGETLTLDPTKLKKREDYFGLVFKGQLNIPDDGEYVFYLVSDDGSRLFINNQMLIENDSIHGPYEKFASVKLKKGKQPIRIEFFDNWGGEELKIYFNQKGRIKQQLPLSMLFRD